jgi:protein SCO1/2
VIFRQGVWKGISLPAFLIALLLIGSQAAAHEPQPRITPGKAERRELSLPIPNFFLTSQKGKPFGLHNHRGKIVLVSFMYTSCPDICPLITTNLRQVQKGLRSGERSSIFILSITTDPEIDSPPVLKSYAERYRVDFSNWSFLTGEEKRLAPVWKAFGVKVQKKARGLIDHTSLTALVDGKGIMRFVYHGTSPDSTVILKDLRTLIAQSAK